MPSISLPTAILGTGLLAGGTSLASGLIGANAEKSAANSQLAAAQLAANTQLGIFNQTQSNLAPYNMVGQSAVSQLASLFGLGPGGGGPTTATAGAAMSALQNYPGYQFQYNQGLNALKANGAAQGSYLSGNQLAAATQYGQGYAQNAWNGYLSNLSNLSSLGENAAATTGNIGQATGANVGNTITSGANNAAATNINATNSLLTGVNSGVNSGLNSALLAYALNNNSGGLQGLNFSPGALPTNVSDNAVY